MKLLLVVIIFAAVTYLAIRWMQDRGQGGQGGQQVPRRPARPQPPTRPVAPDDDESFLRDLERQKRKQQRPPPEPEA